MEIPAHFLGKVSRQSGAPGAAWAQELPSIVRRCQSAWNLTECIPIDDLSINFVCMCRSRTYGEVVLKVQAPHGERYTEIEALQLFAGRHCCPIVALDMPSAAFLLPRLRPGLALRRMESRERQLAIGVDMIGRVPIAVSAPHHLPTYRDWLANTARNAEAGHAPAAMRGILDKATELYAEVESGSGPPVLLHGDLHHDNLLRSGEDDWVAIDPQGVIGPAIMEAGRFIQNHSVYDEGPFDEEELVDTIGSFADGLRQSWSRVAKSFFVLHVLSMCWDWEMNVEPARLERMQDQCREILGIVESR
jgi:streptomycin 6-kinase